MNNSAAKVGEIFREAGIAFNKLSEMTSQLHPISESQPGGKWSEEEIEMLRACVYRFAVDLNKLSQHIKSRTVNQIRTTLKKKAFEDAGIPVRQPINVPLLGTDLLHNGRVSGLLNHADQACWLKVTLNMLNASENEVDVDSLSDVKLEFDGGNDDVAT